jgi:hypothetical protein
MRTSRAALERLLDPENRSVTLNTAEYHGQGSSISGKASAADIDIRP